MIRRLNEINTLPANHGIGTLHILRVVMVRLGYAMGIRTIVPLGEKSFIWAEKDSDYSLTVAYSNPPDYAEW